MAKTAFDLGRWHKWVTNAERLSASLYPTEDVTSRNRAKLQRAIISHVFGRGPFRFLTGHPTFVPAWAPTGTGRNRYVIEDPEYAATHPGPTYDQLVVSYTEYPALLETRGWILQFEERFPDSDATAKRFLRASGRRFFFFRVQKKRREEHAPAGTRSATLIVPRLPLPGDGVRVVSTKDPPVEDVLRVSRIYSDSRIMITM